MNRNYIDDHHIVARYLADQLSEAERSAFETCLLEQPEIVRDLEATAQLKVGLMRLRDSGDLARLMQPQPWHRAGVGTLLRALRSKSAMSAVATVVIALVGTVLWLNARSPSGPWMAPTPAALGNPSRSSPGEPLQIAATYTILRTRGTTVDAEIERPAISAGPQAIALRILPELTARPAIYRLALYSMTAADAARDVATITGLTPDPDEFVPVYIDASKLVAGRYRLVMQGAAGTSGADEPATFNVEVRD